MKHNIKHISIPQPCTQNWADMDVVEQGRFCQSCQKTVTDFTRLSTEEILISLSMSGNTCGRFAEGQLSVVNAALLTKERPRFMWRKLSLAASFIGLFPFFKAEAQVRPKVHSSPVPAKTDTLLAARYVKPDVGNEVAELTKEWTTVPGMIKDPEVEINGVLGGITLVGVEETPNRSTKELIRELFRF